MIISSTNFADFKRNVMKETFQIEFPLAKSLKSPHNMMCVWCVVGVKR